MATTIRTVSARFAMIFEDTWDGATHSRGRWTLVRDCDGERRAVIGTIRDGEDRELVDRVFRSTASTAEKVLACARTIDPRVVAVLDEQNEALDGWTVLYARLPADANARKWKDCYAEAQP